MILTRKLKPTGKMKTENDQPEIEKMSYKERLDVANKVILDIQAKIRWLENVMPAPKEQSPLDNRGLMIEIQNLKNTIEGLKQNIEELTIIARTLALKLRTMILYNPTPGVSVEAMDEIIIRIDKITAKLSRKGVAIVGTQAVPAFEGDQYFSGTAYKLDAKGQMLVRTHSQVMTMACSSWTPDYDPTKDL